LKILARRPQCQTGKIWAATQVLPDWQRPTGDSENLYGWIQLATKAVFECDERFDLPDEIAFWRSDFAEKPAFTCFYRFRATPWG